MSGSNGVKRSKVALPNDARMITVSGLRQLLEAQQYRCSLTGRKLTPDVASVDHVVPLKRGGQNTLDNVQVVHTAVNQAKGTMTLDEFIAMCREVVAFTGKAR